MPLTFLEMAQSDDGRGQVTEQIQEFIDQSAEILNTRLAYICLFNAEGRPAFFCTRHFDQIDDEDRNNIQSVSHQVFNATCIVSGNLRCLGKNETPESPAPNKAFSWLGAQILDEEGNACGAFVIVKHSSRIWSKRQKTHLAFFADKFSLFLKLNKKALEFKRLHAQQQNLSDYLVKFEKKFTALAENIPGAIFSYTRIADGTDLIEFMSPGCVNIWGYAPEEVEADPNLAWNTVLAEDSEALRASIQQSQYDLTRWQHRWRIRDKSGFLKWLQAYGVPYQTQDGSVTWNTFILDVTVEQDAQIALAENTRLLHEAQRLESIGRLAGGVAHDFNNLLSVIMGNAEAINQAKLAADEGESIDEIIEAAQRGAVLVKHLLSFARKSDLRISVANIQSVLSEVDRLLRRVLPSNISLEIIQRAGLWSVQIDKSMFENALLNLVINARDAMPEGGALTIETSNVRVDSEYIELRDEDVKPGRYVMVAITDTGKGIDEGVLPYVFEPFFSTKGPSDGTGLGLAMVQGFVKQSAGIVRIYSEIGHGTSIKMYFPAAESPELSQEVREGGAPRFESKPANILLVEDQDAVRRVIEKVLVSAGYRVLVAQSGDEAIELYQQRQDEIDIIVTDVVMPGKIQGPQLVRLARKIKNSVPALYMSGYPHEANVHGNGIRVGDISLMKPVRRGDLLTALAKLRRQL